VKEELLDPLSVNEYFELGKESLASMYSEYRDISEEQLTLAGRPAIKHLADVGEGVLTFKQMDVYVVEGSMGWVITCTATFDLWNLYAGTFDTIVDSFRLLD
jgi:hypothetical protein